MWWFHRATEVHDDGQMHSLTWPDDASSAASLTFDFDAESVWLAMDPDNVDRPGVLSQARYGPRVGVEAPPGRIDLQEGVLDEVTVGHFTKDRAPMNAGLPYHGRRARPIG